MLPEAQRHPETHRDARSLACADAVALAQSIAHPIGALGMLTLSLPLGVMALIGLGSGMWLRDRVAADAYRGWLRMLLWFLVGLLVLQFFRDLQ